MIFFGYAVILAYVFFLIFGLGNLLMKRVNTETSRKLIHILLFVVWVLIDVFFRNTIHQVIVPIIFIIANALSYRFNIYKSVERTDNNHLGTVYFAIAITVVMAAAYFFPALYKPSGAAAFCLTLGDGFAALIGYNFPSAHLRRNKSILGFAACFVASAVSLLLFRLLYLPELSLPAIGILAMTAAIAELTEHGLDNFTVTFSVFALCGWLLADGSPLLYGAAALSLAVFLIVFLSRSIDYAGSLLSMVMVFCFLWFGGAVGEIFLLASYFSIFFIALLRKALDRRPRASGTHCRGFRQILINGGLGTMLVILYGVLGDPRFLAASMVSIGGCFIDSVSSDVGVLSRAQPYDFLRRTHVERGISGGVTWLGTGAAMVFSALIALYMGLALALRPLTAALMGVLVFLQTVVDTILGSILQVKYRCAVCGAQTEQQEHCGQPAQVASGLRWMDNNAVNLFSSLLVTGLSMAVIWLVV